MNAAVLDSWALLCYLRKEHAHATVVDLLARAADGKVSVAMSLVNLTEVLCAVGRLWGRDKALEVDGLLEGFPVEFVPVDHALARTAARIKAGHAMALGDCFCVALAMERKATVYTGDLEFAPLEKLIRIAWLRRSA